MIRNIVAVAALTVALAGCQSLIGANGAITGLTVPPGCKAEGSFSYPMPQGAIMFSCDETGAVASAAAPHMMRTVPSAPGGAHLTIERQ